MTRTFSVYAHGGGRLFIEAFNGIPGMMWCVVSNGNPQSAAWIHFSEAELADLKTAIDQAIATMHTPSDGRS